MFYDALGSLLGQAGDALEQRGEMQPDDLRTQRETRQIGVLLRRTRGVWPRLFETLLAETALLREGLEAANADLERHDFETSPAPAEADPLSDHRAVLRALDSTIDRLGELPPEAWSETALTRLRRCLAEAADVQGRLVDEMLAIR